MKLLLMPCAIATLAITAHAGVVIYDNTAAGTDDTFGVTHGGVPRGLYDSFTSPTNASITGLSLVLSGLSGSAGSITIGLFANNSNTPGSLITTLGTLSDPQSSSILLDAISLSANPALSAGTRYWIGISSSNLSAIDWANQNKSNTSGTGVVGEFFTVDTSTFSNATGTGINDGAFKMQVTTDTVTSGAPEPSSIVLLSTGGIALWFVRRRIQRTGNRS